MRKKIFGSLLAMVLAVTAAEAAPKQAATSCPPRQQLLTNTPAQMSSAQRNVHRDAQGRWAGTSHKVGNQVVFRDGKGRYAGNARQVGNKVVYRDKSGALSGTAQQVGNRIIYRDARGRYAGSTQVPNRK